MSKRNVGENFYACFFRKHMNYYCRINSDWRNQIQSYYWFLILCLLIYEPTWEDEKHSSIKTFRWMFWNSSSAKPIIDREAPMLCLTKSLCKKRISTSKKLWLCIFFCESNFQTQKLSSTNTHSNLKASSSLNRFNNKEVVSKRQAKKFARQMNLLLFDLLGF
jgi:hypothetical protein